MIEFNPIQTSDLSTREKIFCYLWAMVNMTLFRYSPFFARKWRNRLVRICTILHGGGGKYFI